LLKATHGLFGQIFMLYSDPAHSVEKILYEGNGTADAEVTDEYGVVHRIWRVNNPAAIRLLATAMDDKKLIIADGHHRYETSLNYAREHAPKHAPGAPPKGGSSTQQLPQPDSPESAAMMTFVNMDSDGLVILPTHRVVHGLPGFYASAFVKAAESFFDVGSLPPFDAPGLIETLASQSGIAFVAVTCAGTYLLRAKTEAMNKALADLPERQRQLDLTQLHAVVLDRLLGLDAEKVREQTNLRYLRDAGEAVEQVRRGEADIAFLTNPVTMEQLREVAFAGEVMPQKSTDFFPKLLSGLAIYALE
jgi:uncharacterized protein (DUF1015 family)